MPVAKQIAAEHWVIMISEKDTNKKLPLGGSRDSFVDSNIESGNLGDIFFLFSYCWSDTYCIDPVYQHFDLWKITSEYGTAAFPGFCFVFLLGKERGLY